jgi:2,3-bisphosphoglycerate-dependent phosphoglycerate mutase
VRWGLGRLTVVRHGQSTANVLWERAVETGDPEAVGEGIDADVRLSGLGVEQARALGRWLAGCSRDERPEFVVCSTYARAAETWDVMAGSARLAGYVPPTAVVDERLRDRETGVLDLLPPPAVAARMPKESARRERVGEWFYRPPGGESLADVTLRLRDFLGELREEAAGRRVLLVGHDSTVVAVQHVLAGLGDPVPELFPVPNASVSWWEGDGDRMRAVCLGDVTHL